MADSKIVITAGLDIPDSVNTISKDLSQVKDNLDSDKALKIICNIDLSKTTKRIQSQLDTLSKNLIIKIPEISFGDADKLLGGTEFAPKIKPEFDKKSAESIKRTFIDLADVKKKYQELYGVSDKDVSASWVKNTEGKLSGFSVTVKQAGGVVETFNHTLSEMGEVGLKNITGSDKGIAAIAKTISKAEKDIASFKQSHASILSGLGTPLQEVENALNSLKNGTGSIEDFEKAFNSLKAESAAIGASLKSTGSSFNIFDNAVNKAQNFENELKSLKISIGSVLNDDKRYELTESLSSATIKLEELDEIESRVGKNTEWAEKYKEINSLVQEIANNLKLAQKEDSSFSGMLTAINSKIGRLTLLSGNATLRNNRGDSDVESQITAIETLKSKYIELQSELSKADDPESLAAVKTALVKLIPEFESVVNVNRTLTTSLKNNSALETHRNKVEKLSATMKAFAQANEKAVKSNKLMSNGSTFADEWQKLNDIIAKGSNLSVNELKHLQERFNTFGKEAESAGLKGASAWNKFLDSFKTFSTYVSANMIIGFIKRQISEMIQEVITLDSAMTNLKKVTDETDTGYDKFIKSAKEQARELHTTVADITNQTSEWAKLGYSLSESQELAKTSMIYSKVGEIDNTTSVGDLVATMKAFNIEADNAITIVDSLNKLGNEFATDSASLGEGLSVSASTLATAGNDLSQSLALLTGGTEITQNANEMGNALRTISLRIRGMKGDLEALNEESDGIESISKIQTQILNLTNNKVNIFDSNNKFRNTYDILKDVAEIYYDLSDPSRADLTEILFGKNRANQGIAILQAFQSGRIEEAHESAKNSAGSAQKEFDKLSEGIESHINDFKGAFESLSETVIDSKLMKTVIDSGTTTLAILDSIIDRFDVLPTLLTTIAGISAFKGVGKLKKPNVPIYAPLQ